MIESSKLKTDMTVQYEGNIYKVIDTEPARSGKRSATIKAKMRNLRTGSITEFNLNSDEKLEKANIEKKPMQFLYTMNDVYYFMDMNNYEQIELSKKILGDDCDLLKENLEVDIMFFEGEMLGMLLPDKIELKVTHTEPAVKGNTTSSAMKDATLETGKVIKVPLFIEEDEVVLVSSKDGKYVSRA